MINYEIESYEELSKRFEDAKLRISKEEFYRFYSKSSLQSKLHSFFSFSLSKKYSLFKTGHLAIGLCYLTFYENESSSYFANILFSPEFNVNKDLKIYEEIFNQIESFKHYYSQTKLGHKDLILYNELFSSEERPRFVELPLKMTKGHIVFLSMMSIDPLVSNLKIPGPHFVPVVFNKLISKDIMLLPDVILN